MTLPEDANKIEEKAALSSRLLWRSPLHLLFLFVAVLAHGGMARGHFRARRSDWTVWVGEGTVGTRRRRRKRREEASFRFPRESPNFARGRREIFPPTADMHRSGEEKKAKSKTGGDIEPWQNPAETRRQPDEEL